MSSPDIFSVSRRFDLATVLVAMFGFAVLFTGIRLLDFDATVMGLAGALFVVVAVGQAAAIRWDQPRAASVIAGAAFWMAYAMWRAYADDWGLCGGIVLLVIAIPIGGAAGYLVGALVGGAFLISHHLRETWWMRGGGRAGDAERHTSPWEELASDAERGGQGSTATVGADKPTRGVEA